MGTVSNIKRLSYVVCRISSAAIFGFTAQNLPKKSHLAYVYLNNLGGFLNPKFPAGLSTAQPPNWPSCSARLVMLMLLLSFLMSGATAQATNASCLLQINRSTAGRGLEFFVCDFLCFFCVRYGDSRDGRVNVSVTFAYRNCYHCLWSFSRLSRFIMYAIDLSKL